MLFKIVKSAPGKIQPISSWARKEVAEVHSLVDPPLPPSSNYILPSILWVLYYFKSRSDPSGKGGKVVCWKLKRLYTVQLIH